MIQIYTFMHTIDPSLNSAQIMCADRSTVQYPSITLHSANTDPCSNVAHVYGVKSACKWASLVAQLVKNPPAMQKTLVQFLGQEDLLKKGWAMHSSMLGLSWWLTP